MRVPDVHCHLDQLPDPEGALREAATAGVGPVLAVGMNAVSSTRLLQLRERHPDILRVAIGLHPSEIPALDARSLARELEFVREHLAQADALGEVGLDYKDAVDEEQRRRQRDALDAQLAWAAEFGKPANAHCRRADREILERCARFARESGRAVVLHWFTHSAKLARRAGELGLFISPGPSILDDPLQAAVACEIAGDWLLVETDSPVEFGGQPARPAWAARVATRLAELRGEDRDVLAERLQANWRRYLVSNPGGAPGTG